MCLTLRDLSSYALLVDVLNAVTEDFAMSKLSSGLTAEFSSLKRCNWLGIVQHIVRVLQRPRVAINNSDTDFGVFNGRELALIFQNLLLYLGK